MSVAPAWCAGYIGIPFADKGRARESGLDCWGGVRLVLAEVFGIALPDYRDAYTDAHGHASVGAAVAAGLAHDWDKVATPRAGDIVIIKIAQRPWHCGLMVTPDLFLHWPDRANARSDDPGTSCIERVDRAQWQRRIGGYYRHVGMCEPVGGMTT